MNTQYLKDLLKYRMEQAYNTLHEAEILFDKQAYRGTINRAYYAMFYALLALLSTKNLGTSKHSGAIALFDKEFVKQGLFRPDQSKLFRIAFDKRQMSDYGELTEVDQKTASEIIENAKLFLSDIQRYLDTFSIT